MKEFKFYPDFTSIKLELKPIPSYNDSYYVTIENKNYFDEWTSDGPIDTNATFKNLSPDTEYFFRMYSKIGDVLSDSLNATSKTCKWKLLLVMYSTVC